MKILIVDDKKENILLLETILKGLGNEVLCAENGQKALSVLENNTVDIIISDILMPVMDGFKFCKICKDSANLRDIYFIFLTASFTDEKDEKLALDMGADRFVRKPVDLDELVDLLAKREKNRVAMTGNENVAEKEETLKLYNERLVQKIEQKSFELDKANKELKERVKEINCLLFVSKLTENIETQVEQVFYDILYIMPDGWQYPDITCIRILCQGNEYKSDRFKLSDWNQSSNIIVSGVKQGVIEVYYKEEKPKSVEGPFLLEEKKLLDNIAQIIGRFLERKSAYERINRAHDELEERVRERTKNLEEANIKLKELDNIKSEFISMVSHEFRTPLTSIKAFTEILLNNPDESKERRIEFLEIINNENERLTRLIDDMLDLSKIESGRIEWNMGSVLIADVLTVSISEIMQVALKKNIDIENNFEPGLCNLNADRDKLIQAVINLLSNAVKFTPDNGKIIVGAKAKNGYIEVSVTDSGMGIDEENHHAIFEKFKQINSAQGGKPKGTGLGLAICKQIIEHHKGKIWVESKLGCGSTFYFTIPCSE